MRRYHTSTKTSVVVFAIALLSAGPLTIRSAGALPFHRRAAGFQSDGAAVQSIIEQFYAACTKRDVALAMSLWSEQSPALSTHKSDLEKFLKPEQVDVSELKIGTVAVLGDNATVRVSARMIAFEPKTNTAQMRGELMTFRLVRQNGAWKIWDQFSATGDLIDRLEKVSGKDLQELLAAEKDLVNQELVRSIVGKASAAFFRQEYDSSIRRYSLGVEVADYLHDRPSAANALVGAGNVYRAEAKYPQAFDAYKKALLVFQQSGDQSATASTFDNIAQTCEAQGDQAHALDYFQQALKLYSAGDNQTAKESVTESIGIISYEKDDYDAALAYFKQCLAICDAMEDRAGSSRILVNIGNTYVSLKRYDLALESFEKALPNISDSSDPSFAARAYSDAARAYTAAHQLPKALEYYGKAIQKLNDSDDKTELAETLEGAGFVRKGMGDYPGALSDFNKSLAIHEAGNKPEAAAGILSDIASVYYAEQEWNAAISYYERSLKAFDAMGDTGGVIGSLQNLGNCSYAKSDFIAAEKYYQESLTKSDRWGDKSAPARALDGIGLVRAAMGDFQAAIDSYLKALGIEQTLGEKAELGRTLNNVGAALASQGDFASALEYYNKGLAIDDELGDKPGAAMTLGNIGLAQDSAGLYAAAIDSLDRSLAIERRLVDREGKARALGNLGRVCYDRDETAPALDFLQQSLQLWQLAGKPDAIASAFAAIGNVYYAEKDYSHALDSYQKSLALYESSNSKEGMGFLLAAIASVQYSSGDYNAALETAGKGAAIAREIENREILWYSLLKQGQAELKQQKIDAARQAYSEATSVLDDLRGLPSAPGRVPAFAQGRKTVLGAMADLLMQVDQPEQAFSYAEREKQQVLIDLVRKVRVTRGMTAQESSEERGLIDKLVSADAQNYSERLRGEAAAPTSQLATNARTALQTYRAFEERLYQSRPDVKHRRAMDTTDASGANEILHLPPGTVAFEYVASDDARPYLFTISQSPNDAANEKGIWVSSGNSQPRLAIKAYALNIDPAVLKDKVRQFRQAISSSDGQYETLGRDLYDTLIAPAATDLVGKSHLVVVPDGELWSLPFQALERDGGHFLIEDLPVTYAPSLAALGYALSSEIGGTNRARDQHGASRPTLLEVGAPAIDSSTLGWTQAAYGFDLDAEPSGESAELAAVGAQYGPSRTAALTSNHARKDLLYQEAPKHEYLYISAPGIIDDLNPAYSVILLAGEGPDSKNAGLLTAGEMINADLRSRLVVLSRTEEPAELMRSGEGLIFLEWALLGSGVPAALITQWRTPPGNLTQLMSDLNTEAAAAKIAYHADLSAALRDAVLKMIARPSNRHPFYWAGISALGAAVPAR